jgi:DNA-binding MarR family transcriptional regulator
MDTATEYGAPIDTWFDLLMEIRELEEAGLVAVSKDEDAELRVELTRRGYEYLRRDPA